MNNPADDISQAEKRRIMADERRGRTCHGHAIASADEDRGGRYANAGNSTTVVGASPISYPRQPATSPFACDPCGQEPQPQPQPKPQGGKKKWVVLKPHDPWDNASAYVAEHCHHDGVLFLHFWKKRWYRWDGRCYRQISDEEIKHRTWEFLAEAKKQVGDGLWPFQPLTVHVSGFIEALKAGVFLPEDAEPPRWLRRAVKGGVDVGEAAPSLIAFRNGLMDLDTGEFRKEHSVRFWNHHCLDFDYDPNAKAERWEQYLREVLPNDEESCNFLEEYGGYCMSWVNKFGKAALLHGKPRAGKGAYAWTIEQMVGATAYCPLNINNWAIGENSSTNIIGRKVLCFPDVRLKPGRLYGQSWDPGGLDQKSVGMLLMIIGGDKSQLGIKYETLKWEGKIKGKVIYISNEIPNFNDPSGALPERFIGVNFPRNLEEEGMKDPDLQDKLTPELSGIANRMMAGYRRLMKRGEFIEPSSGRITRARVSAKTIPELVFFNECFQFEAGISVPQWVLLPAWQWWCKKMGQHRLLESIRIGAQVSAALSVNVPGWTGAQTPRKHGADRRYAGVALRDNAELIAALDEFAEKEGKQW